jgi:hypothetical protein
VPALAILAVLKRAGSAVLGFLGHLKFWQLVSIALLLWSLLLLYQRNDARHDRDSYKAQRDYWKGEVTRITSERDQQKKITQAAIDEMFRQQSETQVIVKRIHDAPNPEGCRTPALETLRSVL